MPDQSAIVQELYNRIGSLPPDKASIVSELARRFNVSTNSPADPNYVPDAAAHAGEANRTMAESAIGSADNFTRVPTNPYLGVPTGPAYQVNPNASNGLGGYSPDAGAESIKQGVAQIANTHSGRDLAGGVHKVIAGAGQSVAIPATAAGLVAAPIPTVLGLAGGTLAQSATGAGLKAAGVPDEYADLAGDAAGFVGGGAAAHYGPKVPGALAGALPKPGFKVQLDPTEAASVQYGRDNGVQMPTSVLTGSKVAANAENIAQNLPLASSVAKDARTAERSTLAAAGANEVSKLGNGAKAPSPLAAAEGIHQTAVANEQAHSVAADDSYNLLRSIENQPQFKATVQTGTKLADAGVDESGNPVQKRVPVMEDVQLPVDYRAFKLAVKPLLADALRPMSIAQEQSSTGIKAMRNIVDSPDFVSASVADQDLGALKGIMRDSPQSRSVGQAKFAADFLSNQVDAAVARAGPDAVAALKQGRESTVAKYGAQDFQKAIGFKDVGTSGAAPGEPVALFNKLTAPGDQNINLLRSVQEHAPEQIPAIAQAHVQSLIDTATADAGMSKEKTALTAFNKQGAETKQILYGDRAPQIGSFFTLAKRLADNPNPSGSAQVLAFMKGLGLVVTQPHIGLPMLIGAKPLARMLFDPLAGRNLVAGLETPAKSTGGWLLAKNILQNAGGEATPVSSGTTGAMAPAAPSVPTSGSANPGTATPNTGAPNAGASGTSGASIAPAPGSGGTPGSGGNGLRSADTVVSVPGKAVAGYPAKYALRELDALEASHAGTTFQPNSKYTLTNDRNYATAVNQGKIVAGASRSEFNPALHLTDNPDASNGPIITDSKGQVLGGNGRKMMLDRVYAGNPDGAAAYRALLEQKAPQFGIDPAELAGMKKPVLTREIPEAEFSKPGQSKPEAITDFNKKGTAELTPAERAISDSRRVTPATLEDVASRLDAKGDGATVADILQGKSGGEVLEKLVGDGVIAPQERAAFVGSDGELTPAGKDRISALLIGRFFADPTHLDTIPNSIRNQVERIAAPLAQVESKPEWSLTPHVKDALGILENAHGLGAKNIDDFLRQESLFGAHKYTPEAVALTKALRTMSAGDLKDSARQYASDAAYSSKGADMFGNAPTPADSFKAAFSEETQAAKAAARKEAAKPKANALAPAAPAAAPVKTPKPKNALAPKKKS